MNWQPIETAPRDGTELLLYCPGAGVCYVGEWFTIPRVDYVDVGAGLYKRVESISVAEWNAPSAPSHWMPLPGPPDTRGESRT